MQKGLRNLLVPVAIIMIALGLWQVGGPEQARREYRDDQRVADLHAMAAHLSCLSRNRDDGDLRCANPPTGRDRFTDQPFTITEDRVCAQFEQPDRIASLHYGRIVAGCLKLD